MFPTESYVRAVLGPIEPVLCDLINTAWDDITRSPIRAELDYKRAIATLMHQFLMNRVRQRFVGAPDVHLMADHETIRLLVNRTLRVRLKKMDKRGRTRAAPTQMTMELTNADEGRLFGLAEMPEVYNVDMGYVLNDLETRVDHILVAARQGEAVLWSYEADRGAAEVAGVIAPAPETPMSPGRVIKLPMDRKVRRDDGQA